MKIRLGIGSKRCEEILIFSTKRAFDRFRVERMDYAAFTTTEFSNNYCFGIRITFITNNYLNNFIQQYGGEKMKKIWGISLGILLFLSGCGGDAADEPKDAEGLYKKSCIGCHGSDLKGASGPAVTNMKDKYTEEELHTLIMEGKGMMPGKLLTDEQAQLVAEWLMEK